MGNGKTHLTVALTGLLLAAIMMVPAGAQASAHAVASKAWEVDGMDGMSFSVGVTGKYIAQDLAGFESRTMAFDIGTMYMTGYRHAKLGMSISNFGPDISFGDAAKIGFQSQEFPMPLTFRFGAAIDIMYTESSKLWLSAQLNQPNDNLRYQSLGLEYSLNDMIFLRGGWKIDEVES